MNYEKYTLGQLKGLPEYGDIPRFEGKSTAGKERLIALLIKYGGKGAKKRKASPAKKAVAKKASPKKKPAAKKKKEIAKKVKKAISKKAMNKKIASKKPKKSPSKSKNKGSLKTPLGGY